MLEHDIKTLFALEAAADQPPAQITIPDSGIRARPRRRRRRALAIGSPLLAAAAVTGILVGTAVLGPGRANRQVQLVPPGGPGSATPSASPALGPVRAAGEFDPGRLYASFGWLPPGIRVIGGGTGAAWQFVAAASKKPSSSWTLDAFADGQCALQLVPSEPGRSELNCSQNPDGGPLLITGRAPRVDGRPAYWAGGYLVWRYSAGGWATVQYPDACPGRATRCPIRASPVTVRVARHAHIAAAGTGLRYPVQLTGMPRRWRVAGTSFAPMSGLESAYLIQVSNGHGVLPPAGAGWPDNTPQITVAPTTSQLVQTGCAFSGGDPVGKVINGYQVDVVQVPASSAYPRTQQLCAPDTDGLFVFIDLIGNHPAVSAEDIFRHLRPLGINPAGWVTRLFG